MTENVQNESSSQIEMLEKDLRYIQGQHRIIVDDLRKEIDRLQEENKGNSDKRKCRFIQSI